MLINLQPNVVADQLLLTVYYYCRRFALIIQLISYVSVMHFEISYLLSLH